MSLQMCQVVVLLYLVQPFFFENAQDGWSLMTWLCDNFTEKCYYSNSF